MTSMLSALVITDAMAPIGDGASVITIATRYARAHTTDIYSNTDYTCIKKK